MSLLLILCTPFLILGVLASNLWLPILARERLGKLGASLVRWLHSRSEHVGLWAGPPKKVDPAPLSLRSRITSAHRTKLGILGILGSILFLIFFLGGWVSPHYHLGFLAHFLGSWIGGILAACGILGVIFSFALSFRFLGVQLFASRTGLRRFWLARQGKTAGEFSRILRETFSEASRIEILDFTGFELLAKGTVEEGGMLAGILSRLSEKEVRILLFNPCGNDVDPDRKHSTVIQSQLVSMEMSREAFESKIIATLNRIKALNKGREKPIEVRLYSEKPSFRMVVAGDTAFLGSIDPRDNAGEFPMYEVQRLSEEPSLHAAARAHFLQVWGNALPVALEPAASQNGSQAVKKSPSAALREAAV